MKCPRCGSENVQFYSKTTSHGLSLSGSCCGAILLGPLGVLCGLCGMGSETDEYWICSDCGNKFSAEDGQKHMQSEQKNATLYGQYKEELASLSATEGGIDEIKAKQTAAEQDQDAAKKQKEALLEKLISTSDDKRVVSAAKLENATWPVILLLALLGVAVLSIFVEFTLALILLAVDIILWVVYFKRESKSEKLLLDTVPEYAAADSELKKAKEQKEHYDALAKKVSFVEEYEKAHPQP